MRRRVPAARTSGLGWIQLLGLCLLLGRVAGTQALGAESDLTAALTTASALVRTLSLEEAYDRVLATDQTIQIALTEVRKANLPPWSALTRMGPRVTGSATYTKPKRTLSGPSGFPVATETEGASITVHSRCPATGRGASSRVPTTRDHNRCAQGSHGG